METNREKRWCENAWHKLRMIMKCKKKKNVRDTFVCNRLVCVCVWHSKVVRVCVCANVFVRHRVACDRVVC